jgi:ABC-type nitrate/sulfonate/bicarbonate transport system substrate-binding protein
MNYRSYLGALSIMALLVSSAPASAANINVVWTSEVGSFAPLWVTKEARLFEKYGNSVQLIFIQGASSAAAALSSGDAQVGMFSPQVVISTPGPGADHVRPPRQFDGQSDFCQERH